MVRRSLESTRGKSALLEADELNVSFCGFDADAPDVFVWLALLLERRMERAKKCQIVWSTPGAAPSYRGQQAIRGFRFAEQLRANAAALGQVVVESGPLRAVPVGPQGFIPLSRISRTDFRATESLFRARPHLLETSSSRKLLEQLLATGVLTSKQVETFRASLFLELAWNAVLHSQNEPGAGWCLFAAKSVITSGGPSAIEWAVGDCGNGIVAVLRSAMTPSTALTALLNEVGDDDKRLIARLGETSLSTRPAAPTGTEREGNRGFQHMVSVARVSGSMSLITGPHVMSLEADRHRASGPTWKFSRPFGAGVPSGTLVSGSLRQLTPEQFYSESPSISAEWPREAVFICAGSSVSLEQIDPFEVGQRVANRARAGTRLVVDLCYLPLTGGATADVIAAVLRAAPQSPLILLNMATNSPDFLEGVCDDLVARGNLPALPILCLSDDEDSSVIRQGVRASLVSESSRMAPESMGAFSTISRETHLQLGVAANEEYLRHGFFKVGGNETAGFYRRNVKLFSGRMVGAFFSLSQNTASHAALTRWASTATSVLIEALKPVISSEGDIILLAYSSPIEALARRIADRARQLGLKRVVVWRPYESPSRADLSPILGAGARVVLLSDAKLSGGQLRAYQRIVRRAGGRVAAAIVAVDFEPESATYDVPVRALARIEPMEPDPALGDPLELDPLTLIPRQRHAQLADLVERTLDSLSLIATTSSVIAGHIVDHHRHTDYFIRTDDLCREIADPSLPEGKSLKDIIASRLRSVTAGSFAGFDPTIVLTPQTQETIAVLDAPTPLSERAHADAVEVMLEAVEQVAPGWSGAIHAALPVRRWVDGGGVRCIVPAAIDATAPGADVLVVDDGMYSGHTAKQLLHQLTALRARRVLYIALLARMPLDEVRWWEEHGAGNFDAGRGPTHARFVLPLVLPVPFYAPHDCPQDHALRSVGALEFAASDVRAIAEEVLAESPVESVDEAMVRAESRDRAAAIRGLYWRVGLEVSSADIAANERFRREFEAAGQRDILPVLRVLSREPRLLQRPMLRDWLGDAVLHHAVAVVADTDCDESDRLASSVLVRTAFPDQMGQVLRALGTASDWRPRLLERAAFQTLTLDSATRRSDGVRTAVVTLRTGLRASLPATGASEAWARLRRADGILRELEAQPSEQPPVVVERAFLEGLVEIVRTLREDHDVHMAGAKLQSIALQAGKGQRVELSSARVYYSAAQAASETLLERLLPVLRSLGMRPSGTSVYLAVQFASRTKGAPVEPTRAEVKEADRLLQYLASASELGSECRLELNAVTYLMEGAVRGEATGVALLERAARIAGEISLRVFNPDVGIVWQLLRAICALTVDDAVKGLGRAIQLGLPTGLELQGPTAFASAGDGSEFILCPRPLFEMVSSVVVRNLGEALLAPAGSQPSGVPVAIKSSVFAGILDVEISGPIRRAPQGPLSPNTRSVDQELRAYGGRLHFGRAEQSSTVDEAPERFIHSARFALAPREFLR